ncbi:MAG: VWA domain-containing protein, partial [Candidatus Dormiibacterota bacterium]
MSTQAARESATPDLVPRVAAFGRLLHDVGLEVGPARLQRATDALTYVDLKDQVAFRDTLRACLVSRRDALPIFEAAFDLFWAPPEPNLTAGSVPGKSRPLPMAPERAKAWMDLLGLNRPNTPRQREEEVRPESSSGYSQQELLRQKDFDELSWEESEQVARMLRQAPWRVAERRTRRLRPAKDGPIDLRRTVRRSIHSGGEMMSLLHRRPRRRRRPIVLLCDVSGSMERYTRLLLIFAHSVARREDVETFVFSTRLSRITRLLRQRDIDRALEHVSKQVHDFSGGTRIGRALAEFNRRWARRVLGHGAVVVVISDGWDRGEPEELATELQRLRRLAYRLIWLNPLLGSAGYEPVTRGMAAALPHCDDFLAANNIDALDELGRLLAGLDR